MERNSHKDAATEFLRLAASGSVREAYRKHVAAGFRHHNPHFRGDAESLATAMEENAARFPDKKLEILRAIEEDDLVADHGRVRMKPDDPGIALVHIFRFEGGRLAATKILAEKTPLGRILINHNVLRRIEPTGFVDRVRGRQTALLNTLFQDSRLSRLVEQEATQPAGRAYTLAELFGDVRRGDHLGKVLVGLPDRHLAHAAPVSLRLFYVAT